MLKAYPEEVHKKLRRALYFATHEKQEKEALRYFREALLAAEEYGMDPLSNEVMGIKIKMAGFLEEQGSYALAIKVLETARGECLAWENRWGWKPENKMKRTKALKHAVAISVKLASLYGSEYVQAWERAEERLTWAVETQLKEAIRREEEGVREEEGPWMSDEEFGGSFEGMFGSDCSSSRETIS